MKPWEYQALRQEKLRSYTKLHDSRNPVYWIIVPNEVLDDLTDEDLIADGGEHLVYDSDYDYKIWEIVNEWGAEYHGSQEKWEEESSIADQMFHDSD